MANATNTKALQSDIDAWAKGQAVVEKTAKEHAEARLAVQPYAKRVYDALGTKPFTVKALGGRKYRAMFVPEKKNEKTGRTSAASYRIIPVPEFESENTF